MSVPEGVRPSSTEIKNEDVHTLDAGEPFCQVPGCLAEEEPGQAKYYRRFRICRVHATQLHVQLGDNVMRFCQQCGRFQELSDFDGDRRSCKDSLDKHNARRRRAAAAASANKIPHYGRAPSHKSSQRRAAQESPGQRAKRARGDVPDIFEWGGEGGVEGGGWDPLLQSPSWQLAPPSGLGSSLQAQPPLPPHPQQPQLSLTSLLPHSQQGFQPQRPQQQPQLTLESMLFDNQPAQQGYRPLPSLQQQQQQQQLALDSLLAGGRGSQQGVTQQQQAQQSVPIRSVPSPSPTLPISQLSNDQLAQLLLRLQEQVEREEAEKQQRRPVQAAPQQEQQAQPAPPSPLHPMRSQPSGRWHRGEPPPTCRGVSAPFANSPHSYNPPLPPSPRLPRGDPTLTAQLARFAGVPPSHPPSGPPPHLSHLPNPADIIFHPSSALQSRQPGAASLDASAGNLPPSEGPPPPPHRKAQQAQQQPTLRLQQEARLRSPSPAAATQPVTAISRPLPRQHVGVPGWHLQFLLRNQVLPPTPTPSSSEEDAPPPDWQVVGGGGGVTVNLDNVPTSTGTHALPPPSASEWLPAPILQRPAPSREQRGPGWEGNQGISRKILESQGIPKASISPGTTQEGVMAGAATGAGHPPGGGPGGAGDPPPPKPRDLKAQLERVSMRWFNLPPDQLAPHVLEGVISILEEDPEFADEAVPPC